MVECDLAKVEVAGSNPVSRSKFYSAWGWQRYGPDFFKKQQGEIQSRRVGNRTGFGCITVGATLQLLGTLISGFVPN